MLIKTSEGEKNVASKGLGAAGLTLGIIGTSLAGVDFLRDGGRDGGRGLLGGFFGGRGERRDECGYEHCAPVLRPWQYEDKIIRLEDKFYTNEKVNCLEEKVERMLGPVYAQLKALEINAAVDNAVEAQRDKDYAVIDKLKYYIDQLEDDKYVKKSWYHPCGSRLAPCGGEERRGDDCVGCERR
jgi:hypothetical protein